MRNATVTLLGSDRSDPVFCFRGLERGGTTLNTLRQCGFQRIDNSEDFGYTCAMVSVATNTTKPNIWDSLCAFPEPHSRARDVETTCCARVTFTKSLERIEIPQCIYDSRVGLGLLSKDPIGFAAGDTNLYRMTGNHPNMATDPSGLFEKPGEGGTATAERPKRVVNIPRSVVKLQVAAAERRASVTNAAKSSPRSSTASGVGFAIGYMQAIEEGDRKREQESASRQASVDEYVVGMITGGLEGGLITSDQADSLARKYSIGWRGQYRGAYHAYIEYRLATEVTSGKLSTYSQLVLSDQLTGSWNLPSQKKIDEAIAVSAAVDAQKAAALAALAVAQNSQKEQSVSIYRASRKGLGAFELHFGYFPSNYSIGNRSAHFSRELETASDYAYHGPYENFVIEVTIPKSEYDERYLAHEKPLLGKPGSTEVVIPSSKFKYLNQHPRVQREPTP